MTLVKHNFNLIVKLYVFATYALSVRELREEYKTYSKSRKLR